MSTTLEHECAIEWRRFPVAASKPDARAWLELVELRGRDPKTVEAYGRAINEFLVWLDGRPHRGLGDADLYLFISHLRSRGKLRQLSSGAALKSSTLQQKLTALRLFYDDLIRRGIVEGHPLPRGTWSDNPRDRRRGPLAREYALPWIPNDSQWSQFLQVARHEPVRTRLMILLAYEGALRRETLVGLQVGDVDLPNRLVVLRPEIVKDRHANVVTFSRTTAKLYAQYLAEWKMIATRSRKKNFFLFRSLSDRNYGAGLSVWTWNKVVTALAARAELPRFTPHTFRHLRLTHMARAGFELLEIAKYAGHRSLETTMQYIHLSGRDLDVKVARNMQIMEEQIATVAHTLG